MDASEPDAALLRRRQVGTEPNRGQVLGYCWGNRSCPKQHAHACEVIGSDIAEFIDAAQAREKAGRPDSSMISPTSAKGRSRARPRNFSTSAQASAAVGACDAKV